MHPFYYQVENYLVNSKYYRSRRVIIDVSNTHSPHLFTYHGCDQLISSTSDLLIYIFHKQDEDPQLVNPDPKYECLICVQNNNNHRLLRDPVQTTCGHRICRTCVEIYLGTERSKICPAGEHDCEVMTRNNVSICLH